jgi:hypothetical protein
VCRKNSNSKVRWQLVSTPTSSGVAHMLTDTGLHFLTSPALPYAPATFHHQYLMTPNSTPMTPYSGAPRMASGPTVSSLPWTVTSTGVMLGVLLLLLFLELMLCPLRMAEIVDMW